MDAIAEIYLTELIDAGAGIRVADLRLRELAARVARSAYRETDADTLRATADVYWTLTEIREILRAAGGLPTLDEMAALARHERRATHVPHPDWPSAPACDTASDWALSGAWADSVDGYPTCGNCRARGGAWAMRAGLAAMDAAA